MQYTYLKEYYLETTMNYSPNTVNRKVMYLNKREVYGMKVNEWCYPDVWPMGLLELALSYDKALVNEKKSL